MRPVTVRRLGSAAAAVAAGLAVTVLAACGSSPGPPGARSTVPTSALPSGPAPSATTGPASAAPSACSLLRQADVLAVAATFRGCHDQH